MECQNTIFKGFGDQKAPEIGVFDVFGVIKSVIKVYN